MPIAAKPRGQTAASTSVHAVNIATPGGKNAMISPAEPAIGTQARSPPPSNPHRTQNSIHQPAGSFTGGFPTPATRPRPIVSVGQAGRHRKPYTRTAGLWRRKKRQLLSALRSPFGGHATGGNVSKSALSERLGQLHRDRRQSLATNGHACSRKRTLLLLDCFYEISGIASNDAARRPQHRDNFWSGRDVSFE